MLKIKIKWIYEKKIHNRVTLKIKIKIEGVTYKILSQFVLYQEQSIKDYWEKKYYVWDYKLKTLKTIECKVMIKYFFIF